SGGGGSGGGGGGSGGGGGGGTGGGSGGSGGGGGGSGGSGDSGGGGCGGGRSGPRRGGPGGGQRQQQQCRSETQSPHAEGDCYRCVPPDPGIAAAALGASAIGTPPGTAPAEALHTFTLDSDASRSTPTPLPAPIPVRLADPSGGTVAARSSTVLPCLAVPSGSLSGLHLPSFSTNLVSTAALQDALVTTTTPGSQRVSICMCTGTGRHLATFTRRPGSSLYMLATKPPQVAASAQVSASGQVAASCSCPLLSHQTLLWHHRLGHPFLPCLRGMPSRFLVSGLPRSLPPLPPSPAPPCLPCVEGRQRAAPHSSSCPPTTAPLQTLHMDVWGPARVSGQSRKRFFLLVVDDYTRYTTGFPLRSKGEIPDVFIPWISTVRLQLRERFGTDLPVLCLHSDRCGEFSSDLLREFCRGKGILQSFMLPDSPQQNGIAKRRIGLVMEVARTSMIHAAAPHYLWPFAVRYAAHQLNLWPLVSLPETSPTLRWTGKVGDALVFQVWGSRAFVRDTSADKLSARAIPCVILGFVPDAPGWQFYHPTLRRVLLSQDVTFNESAPFYRLFPYRSAPPPPPPLFLAPGPPPVDPHPPPGPAPLGVSQVDPLLGTAPVQVDVCSCAAPGAAFGGAASGVSEPGCAGSEGARSGGAEPGGAEPKSVELGGAESEGALSGGPAGASPRLSPQQLREWLVRHAHRRSGAPGAGGAGDTGAGAGDPTEPGAAGAGGAGAAGAGVGGTGARGVDLQKLELLTLALESGGLAERREPASRPVSPVRTARRAPRSHPPPVPGTHTMALRPSSAPLRVPLPAHPDSSLPEVPDPASDHARVARPTVSRLLATAFTDPSFESATASALVAELLDFAAACRLDNATALVAESVSASPPSVGGECALGTDVLEDRQDDFECLAAAVPRFASMLLAPEGDPDAPHIPTPRSYAEAITGPYSSQCQAAMDAEMASWKSTGTYVDEVPPSRANIVDGMWIFRVKRPPGSPPTFKARYVARVPCPFRPFPPILVVTVPFSSRVDVAACSRLVTFDAEGRAVDFEVWVDDLQLFLQCDRADGLSLFDLTSGASPALPDTADSTVRSQWATRDAAARLAVRRHLPTTMRAYFSQYKSAQTLYDAVVARYSSPATAALSRLFLPYLFPDLAAFPTVADLITHLRTSDTRYRAALPAEFCAKNPPPIYLTLYYVVTRLPDSLRVVRDHFLSVCPTTLTVDLLEERLLAAEQSIVAVGASRGDPRTPIFEGCSPSPLLPSVASATAADLGAAASDSLDFSTAFLQGSLHEEIWLRRPPGFTWSFPPGTQWSLRRPVYVDDLVFATADTAGLAHVKSFTYSSPQATPLSTRHSLSALPLDESVEPSGPYPELVGCLMYLMTCTRPDLAYPLSILARYVAPGRHRPEHMAAAKRVLRYLCSTSGMGLVLGGRRPVVLTGHADASWADDQAMQRSSQGYTFSLGSGSVSWRSTRSSSVLSSSCEAEIYAGAMAAQELRWLTYLLPCSPPVLYVDNKAMLALCREQRLEHRTKHIALRYFLARELQQRGQLRLAYVASKANTADFFTKALAPGDHQRFCTMLACFPLLDWSCDLFTAFLQGSLHEEIRLCQPPGFTGTFQWSLRRPVYGLRQAPREWQDTLRTTLAALGFAPSTADPSLFLRTDTSLPPFYVLVSVDDLVFATADTEALTLVKSELQKRHTFTDLGELRSYLCLQITRDRARRTITLTQSHMVHQVLQRFGFQFSSPQPTSLSNSYSLSAPPSEESVEPSGPFPELVGCLIMSGMGLVLGGRGPLVLTGHADASWVDDSATQRSSQGYTFILGSGSVSWRPIRSPLVLSSSCEAEIYAGAMAAQELRLLTYLLTDLGELPHSPPVLYVDNKAMIALC
ncbi:unnamed protein product, partial [Closterium sp. NIES-53]